jgi:arabinogalactan oligomer / maltooligosaccharide transport system permease protein
MSYVEMSSEAGQAVARTAKPARKVRKRGERGPLASIGLHAALIALVLFAVIPIIWLITTSFKPNTEILSADYNVWSPDASLDNYTQLLNDTEFPTWFKNSVIVAGFTMALGILVSATAGYAVSRFRFPGYRPLMWTFLVVQMFLSDILIVEIYTIMSSLGLLNEYASLVIAYLATAVPFTAWLLKGYFDSIPIDIDEAGRVDGLNPFGTFWYLILPLARPGLAVTAFYTFLTAWGEVAYAQTFMITADKYTLAVGIQTFVGQFLTEWGLLTAAGVLIMIPAMIVFFFAQKHLVAGLTAGGTKG